MMIPLVWSQCPNSCSDNGECVHFNQTNNFACECYPEFAYDDCSYHRKSMNVALGLELGFGIIGIAGLGRLYLGYVFIGIIHLAISLFFCCGCCCITVRVKIDGDNEEDIKDKLHGLLLCLGIVWFIYFLVMFTWWLTECISIGTFSVPDINSIGLY